MVTKRAPDDFYATPAWAIDDFLERFAATIPAPERILEPCAGDGAFLEPLRRTWPAALIDAFDLTPRHSDVLGRDAWMDDGEERYDLVITNPPYKHAEAFVGYGLSKLKKSGRLALLLRLGFLGSKHRRRLWRTLPAESIWVLPERPSFRGGKTDFSEYGFFVWKQGSVRTHAKLRVL